MLTEAGYREAQAVGYTLAETLKVIVPRGLKVGKILYAGENRKSEPTVKNMKIPLIMSRMKEKPSCLQPDREPEATAEVVKKQLITAERYSGEPEPWPAIAPRQLPSSENDPRDQVRRAAEELEGWARDCNLDAVLVVGNSPQIEWVAEWLRRGPLPIDRGEVVCLSEPRRRWQWLLRRRRELLWAIGPDQKEVIEELRAKIRSKMDTAKFLGVFITGLVTFVLSKRIDALKPIVGGQQSPVPPQISTMQNGLWLLTVASLGVAALLCFTALYYYDRLLMPTRYWAQSARPSRAWWLAERPPSSAAWVLYQNMTRTWKWLVVPAIYALGVALLAFAVLVLADPKKLDDLVRLNWILIALAILLLAVFYVVAFRPRLGVKD